MNNRPQVQLLGGDRREAGCQIKAHLVTEDAQRAHAGAVFLGNAMVEDMVDEIQILAHRALLGVSAGRPWGVWNGVLADEYTMQGGSAAAAFQIDARIEQAPISEDLKMEMGMS